MILESAIPITACLNGEFHKITLTKFEIEYGKVHTLTSNDLNRVNLEFRRDRDSYKLEQNLQYVHNANLTMNIGGTAYSMTIEQRSTVDISARHFKIELLATSVDSTTKPKLTPIQEYLEL